jgi:hypothetical protein
MMKTMKSQGGLTRGRGMTESVRTLWVGTMHQGAQVHLAMSNLTDLHEVNQDHVDIGYSRASRDCSDMQKFIEWLESNDPFSLHDGKLHSLSSGLVASDSDGVTADTAEEIGAAIQQKINGLKFYEIKMKKSEQVKTLAQIEASTSVQKAKEHQMNSSLFHRLLILTERSTSISSFFKYELTSVPSTLFKDGYMWKPDKAALAKALLTDR